MRFWTRECRAERSSGVTQLGCTTRQLVCAEFSCTTRQLVCVVAIAQTLVIIVSVYKLRSGVYLAAGTTAMNNMEHMEMNHSGHHMMEDNPHAGHDMSGHDMSGHDMSGHDMTDHSSHAGASTDHSSHGGMMMYFHISNEATILFEPWKTDSWQGMLGSCVAIFIMAALYEGLKVAREHLLKKYSTQTQYQVNGKQLVPTCDTVADIVVQQPISVTVGSRMCSISHLLQTVLHVFQIVISYFLMLVFMTYNLYLCVAVALGAGTGYFLFSWKRSTIIDVNEHCH